MYPLLSQKFAPFNDNTILRALASSSLVAHSMQHYAPQEEMSERRSTRRDLEGLEGTGICNFRQEEILIPHAKRSSSSHITNHTNHAPAHL